MSYYFPNLTKENSLNYVKIQARTTANIVALNAAAGLANGDYRTVKEAFKLSKNDYNLNFLAVYNTMNKEVASFNPNKLSLDPNKIFKDDDNEWLWPIAPYLCRSPPPA